MRTFLRYTFALSLFFWGGGQMLCGQVIFEARVASNKIATGSEFEVRFVLENASGRKLRMPDFSPFTKSGYTDEQRGYTSKNGRQRSFQAWAIQLKAPSSPGNYKIPSASVYADGKLMKSAPITIRVVNQEPFVPYEGHSSDVFIRAEFSKDTVFVGEQTQYRLVLYTTKTISGYDILDFPEADKAYYNELKRFDSRTRYVTVNGQQYVSKTLYEMAIFPQVAGELEVDKSIVKLGVEQERTMGMLIRTSPLSLTIPSRPLFVQPLPIPAPEGFTGGVGNYHWELHCDRTTLSTDEAATITVAIRGNGDMRRFSPPRFQVPAGLEVFAPKETDQQEFEAGSEVVHTLQLDYALVPKEPGEYTFSPELVFFDPDSLRYQTVRAETPFTLNVTPGNRLDDEGEDGDNQFFGPESDNWFERIPAPLRSPAWLLLLLLIPAFLLFRARNRRKKRAASVADGPEKQVKARFNKEGLALAKACMEKGDEKGFYQAVYRLVQASLGSRLGLDVANWNESRLVKRMDEARFPAPQKDAILQLLRKCEQVLYAGADKSGEMNTTLKSAEDLLRDL